MPLVSLIQRKQGAAAERTAAVEPSAAAAGNVEDDFWSTVDTAAKQACTAQDAADVADGAGIGYVAEFKACLNAGPLDRKSHPNPLEAWEGIKHLYPNVYEVAMMFLPILCSSIPCERLFGLIATQLRNRLSGKNLNTLIFLRSIPEDMWFKKAS
ncbi:Alanine--tRNA ligase [Frankliniella fusca]|uniref:Alanine--tRNA ligase n=1 Tax=Frankliniella fusca TaxID=407009 RepID=A0AAE1I2Q3_9NEOP|nr:Alanine--tRNA ligase [Frankliniella fusca]